VCPGQRHLRTFVPHDLSLSKACQGCRVPTFTVQGGGSSCDGPEGLSLCRETQWDWQMGGCGMRESWVVTWVWGWSILMNGGTTS
jgi:hypothetical protein